jgi:competence protein ComGC
MQKKAFSLMEILVSTIIVAVVVITALNIMTILNDKNDTTYNNTVTKIDIEATRVYLENQAKQDISLEKLVHKNKQLFYDNTLLLNNISSFTKVKKSEHTQVDFCVKIDKEVCTKMVFK